MAQKLYEETHIQNIANAIRAKNGSTTKYKTSEMASAIRAISSTESGSGSGPVDENAYFRAMVQSMGKIDNLIIPEGTTLIREYCFRQMTIYTVTFPSTLSGIGQNAFANCSTLKQINFNEGLRNIYGYAFYGCYDLTELTFPSSIKNLHTYSFYYCSDLTTVTFKGTPDSIESDVFGSCDSLTDIYVPWSYGAVAGAPWGATNAIIHYNSVV